MTERQLPAPPFFPPSFLAGTRLVLARELRAWFDGAIATVALVAALLAVLSLFMNEFFVRGRLDMAPFFERLPLVLVLFAPALAMRLWAEDKKLKTFELWMTLPLTPLQIVLGKYAAALLVYAVFLLGTLPIPILLFFLGSPDPGPIVAGYLGAALLGALFLALGQLVSGLTSDQIVAFLATALLCAFLVATGEPRVVAALDGLAPSFAPGLALGTRLSEWVSALPRFDAFARGAVSLAGLVYFAGLAAVALAANAASVARIRT